jgi:Ring finger domain
MTSATGDTDHTRTILSILRDLVESDRSFYHSPVFALPEPIRGRTLLNQSRTTGAILDLLRMMFANITSIENEPRFVVTIPMPDFEDVPIIATNAQIDAAMAPFDTMVDTNCSICQDTLTSGSRLRCSHMFHTACIRNWFQMNSRCPVCRHDIREPTG